jgi:hypothetical protein
MAILLVVIAAIPADNTPDNQSDNAAYFDRHKQSVSDSMDRNKPVYENNRKSFNNQKLSQTDSACHKWGKMGRGGFEPPTHGFSVGDFIYRLL